MFHSSGNHVRSVEVKVGENTYIRSVNKLVDLEVSATDPVGPGVGLNDVDHITDNTPCFSEDKNTNPLLSDDGVLSRPKRRAALQCNEL